MLIDGPGAQSGKDIAAQELVAQVDNAHLGSAGLMGLFYDGVDVIALANIGDHGNHVAVVVLLEPGNDDGGVESSGICQDNFLTHDCSLKAPGGFLHPAIKEEWLSARASDFQPGRRLPNAASRSRWSKLPARGGPEDSA